jgi:hypothetical protein
MARTPGSGRQLGTQNRITTAFKDAIRIVYQDIGGDAAFAEWARANRGDFYRIASRMIPAELNIRAAPVRYNVIVDRDFRLRDQETRHHATPVTFENSAPPLLKGDGGKAI